MAQAPGPISSALAPILMPLEEGLASIGLGSPIARFGVGFAATEVVVQIIQPTSMFLNGQARPWVLAGERSAIEPTLLTHWLASGAVGLLFATLI